MDRVQRLGAELAGANADESARQWLARLHSGSMTAQDRARFEAWLAASPEHPTAYRRAEQLWRDLSLIESLSEIDIEEPPRWSRGRRVSLAAAAGIAVMAVLSVGAYAWLATSGKHYATDIAEIREFTLPDGTRVALGARSELAVDFTSARRSVHLKSGEAFFSVSRDATRPFYVSAGHAQVRVLGTQFDVRRGLGEVRVAVMEGSVEVMRADSAASSPPSVDAGKQVITAGQELVAPRPANNAGRFLVRAIDPAQPGAWRRGRLSYENATLDEVIADANRYSEHEIVFADENLRSVRVTTAFRTEQIGEMLAGLAATHPIVIDRSRGDRIVLRPQP